jgi:hypothetical protein
MKEDTTSSVIEKAQNNRQQAGQNLEQAPQEGAE